MAYIISGIAETNCFINADWKINKLIVAIKRRFYEVNLQWLQNVTGKLYDRETLGSTSDPCMFNTG